MALVRISDVKPLNAFHVEITLTTGEIVQRDLRPLLKGPVFDSIHTDEQQFRQEGSRTEAWFGREAATVARMW